MTSTAPFRSRLSLSLFAILLGACSSDGDPPPPSDPDPDPDPVVDLEALAERPEIQATNLPYGQVPPADQSRHLTVSDGTRLAINVYFPPGLDRTGATGKAPAVYVDSWYGRLEEALMLPVDMYRQAGLVVVIADSRGFGASFGAQEHFMTARARADHAEVIAWMAAQPWSSGAVASVGLSLSATMADIMNGSGAPALKASIIRAADFDHYDHNLFPGGVPSQNMIGGVMGLMVGVRGEACVLDPAACRQLHPGMFPAVEGDIELNLLREALISRAGNVDGAVLASVRFRDDQLGGGGFADMSALGHLPAIRAAALPARVSASWTDGVTAQGALQRFESMPAAPMEVVIGATTHSGGLHTDPFARTPFQTARPGADDQFRADIAFLKDALAGRSHGRGVRYLVLGSNDTWKVTPVWPPAGVVDTVLGLTASALVPAPATAGPGTVSYTVDPGAGTPAGFNRWASQRNRPVHYGDRRLAAGRRLSFDAAPVKADTELVGAPELCLAMTTDKTDGVVIAYLEDVAPDGRVTYLTEGQLRLLHRQTEGAACDPAPGTRRTFNRADALAVVPGQPMRFELPLLPTAALVKKGHHLRLSLAGADAGTFAPLTEGPATWSVNHGGAEGSTLRLPTRPWTR